MQRFQRNLDSLKMATTTAATGSDEKYDVTKYNIPYYQMDVVPYITLIKTSLKEE